MKKSEIEKMLRNEVITKFTPYGFKGKLSSPLSSKEIEGAIIKLSSTIETLGIYPACEFHIGFHVGKVEELIHSIIPYTSANKEIVSLTLTFPWHVFLRPDGRRHLPAKVDRLEIQGDDYFSIIVFEFRKLYLEKIEPFLVHYSTMEHLDELFNTDLSIDLPYRYDKVERAIRGILIRSVVNKSTLSHLIEQYKDYVAPYLPDLRVKFDKVVSALEAG